jgi:ADP-ribose pyrophosphatase
MTRVSCGPGDGMGYPLRVAKKSAKILSARTVFKGKLFTVAVENIADPEGNKGRRDIVHHGGSVVILPVDDSGREPRVLLVRQFRHAAGQYLWEFPAGGLDGDEDPLVGGKRELVEETGYTSDNWRKAMFFYVSPGFLDESMTLFLAQGLKKGKAQPEDDEFITKRLFPLKDALKMVLNGKILDAKTIAGVFWLNEYFGSPRAKKV